MAKEITGLKQAEKYHLMKWVDENRDKALASTDEDLANYLREHLGIETLTKWHVAGARKSLGILKVHVVPSNRTGKFEELMVIISSLAEVVYELAEKTGNHLSAKEAYSLAKHAEAMLK